MIGTRTSCYNYSHRGSHVCVKRSAASVCLTVCPHDKTKTAETKIVKLNKGIVHHDLRPSINIRSKGQRSKSHIEGDRVVGVSLHTIECPAWASSYHYHYHYHYINCYKVVEGILYGDGYQIADLIVQLGGNIDSPCVFDVGCGTTGSPPSFLANYRPDLELNRAHATSSAHRLAPPW